MANPIYNKADKYTCKANPRMAKPSGKTKWLKLVAKPTG